MTGLHFSTVLLSGKSSKSPEDSLVIVHCIIRILHLLITHTGAKLIEQFKQFKLPTAYSYLCFQFPPSRSDWGMSHLSPGVKLQAKKEFSLEDIVQDSCTSPFPLQCESAELPRTVGRTSPPALPATGALHFSCSLFSCRWFFQTFWSKGFKVTEVPCGRAAQNEVFSPPSMLTFPLQHNHWFH